MEVVLEVGDRILPDHRKRWSDMPTRLKPVETLPDLFYTMLFTTTAAKNIVDKHF